MDEKLTMDEDYISSGNIDALSGLGIDRASAIQLVNLEKEIQSGLETIRSMI